MCVTKYVMVRQMLVWFGAYPEKQKAFDDLAETIDTVTVPIIATKEPITPSIPIARGLITRHMTSAYKILRSQPFEFCLLFEFYFYPFSAYLQAKYDSSCA